MRQSFLAVLGVVASMTAQSNADFSRWVTNFNEMAPVCKNGPVPCGTDEDGADINCKEGYACYNSTGFSLCDDVAQWQCHKNCPDGKVLDPLRYCTCITQEELEKMFCCDPNTTVCPGPEYEYIGCPGGQEVKCRKGDSECIDNSPTLCPPEYMYIDCPPGVKRKCLKASPDC